MRSLAKGSTWSESEGNGISPLLPILGFVAGVSFRGWGDAQEAQDRAGSRSGRTTELLPIPEGYRMRSSQRLTHNLFVPSQLERGVDSSFPCHLPIS